MSRKNRIRMNDPEHLFYTNHNGGDAPYIICTYKDIMDSALLVFKNDPVKAYEFLIKNNMTKDDELGEWVLSRLEEMIEEKDA